MIRLAVLEDFTSIMSIYAYARSFMQETGNPNQWGNHFPPEELIHNRIRDKQLFVLEENGTLHGAFAFIIGEDPTYLQIDDDDEPVHILRIISENLDVNEAEFEGLDDDELIDTIYQIFRERNDLDD